MCDIISPWLDSSSNRARGFCTGTIGFSSGEVLKVFGNPADGDVISLKDGRDHLIGSAIYNSKSQIVARRFSRRKQDLDLDFFQRRIAQAMEYRKRRGIDPRLCRARLERERRIARRDRRSLRRSRGLANADAGDGHAEEADRGGVEDGRSENPPCNQSSSATMRRCDGRKGWNCAAVSCWANRRVKWKSRSPACASGSISCSAQKTGLYLDQLPHYGPVASTRPDGACSIASRTRAASRSPARGPGATKVTAVEASAENHRSARKNGERNQLSVDWIEQDVFQFLRAAEKAEAEFDLIILDPPSFTKTKGGLRDALRGYRELHVRAFKLLSHDGLLATFSCSHHVNETIFDQTIADALVDARRSARRLRRFEQALDHPVLPTLPETEYFKGVLLEMMPGR